MAEPWGLTLNEAIAENVPCISTYAVAAADDLIENGKNGYIVREKDPNSLQEAIQKVVRLDQHTRTAVNREKSETFTYENMAHAFLKAIGNS